MEGTIVHLDFRGTEKKLLLRHKEYQCRYYRAYYGIIVIEDIGKALPGTVIGTYATGTLTISTADEKLVLTTKTARLETGLTLIGLNPTVDKHGDPVVEVIKPYTITA